MNKRHLHLYAALFLASLLLSATVISAYAEDSQLQTVITYEAPSSADQNTYEIHIPSSLDILYNEFEKSIPISISDNYNLEPTYVVHVDLTSDSFDTKVSDNGTNQYIRLYNAADSDYYYTLIPKDSNNTPLYYNPSGDSRLEVATFHSDSSQNTGGQLNLFYSGEASNDTTYRSAATYLGYVTFNIYGQYE